MTTLLRAAAAAASLCAFIGIGTTGFQKNSRNPVAETSPSVNKQRPASAPKIQAAILLDVSNSMDGLIEQAKAQLWNMVSVMGRARCNGEPPQIEIALYEYGSPRNDAKGGYVKQLSPFTTDLDGLSKTLFGLTTNGGDEYCGQAIFTSVSNLAWDTAAGSYKVIFIAGNEDFLQGSLHYTRACNAAKEKGIVVNTIYRGDRLQGIREHWNLNAKCGNGSYTNINPDARAEDLPTPYDSTLVLLNERLNGTYIGYGSRATDGYASMAFVDVSAQKSNKSAALKRISVKGNKKLYNNAGWDLVDAAAEKDGEALVEKLDLKTLRDSLKHRSRADIRQLVKAKKAERESIQSQIAAVSIQRESYLAEERKKRAATNAPTLESETEKLLKTQARRYNMIIE